MRMEQLSKEDAQKLIDRAIEPIIKDHEALVERMNTHKHTDADLTKKLVSDTATSSVTVYAGYVHSNGTAGTLPAGWSSSRTGAGQFIVTHNLGTVNYAPPVITQSNAYGKLNALNANDVQYTFLDYGGALIDTDFWFTIVLM